MDKSVAMNTAVLLLLLAGAAFGVQRPEGLPADVTEQSLKGVVITLARSACYGSCPVYKVEIHGDGAVTFKGIEYVTAQGTRRYKIPAERVRELVAEFYKIDFFALKDEYTHVELPGGLIEEVTDLPSTTVTISIGGRTKSVLDYYGTPPQVRQLEDKIDEVSGADKFIPPAK